MAGDLLSTLGYDRLGNISSVTDGRSHVTISTWDDFGNVQSIQSPDTGLTKLGYDLAGNLTSRVDARNQTITMSYDALDRPIRQSYPGAARDTVLSWDTGYPGKLSGIQEEYSDRSFEFNNRVQLTAETRTIGALTTTCYGYDDAIGDLETITYPSGRVLQYSRDAMDRITGMLLDGSSLAAAIQHLPFGPAESVTLGTVMSVVNSGHQNEYQAASFCS